MKKFKSYSTSRKVITIILIISAILVGYKILDATCYLLVRAKAEIYFCIKYDAKPGEIDFVDHQRAHIYWDDDNIFWLNPEWVDFSFEYIYNDKSFFVNRYKGEFYDDYQIDDVEKWCTEWLQKNVDETIVGIELESINIPLFIEYANKNIIKIVSKNDAEMFLKNYFEKKYLNSQNLVMLYVNDKKITKSVQIYEDEIRALIKKYFDIDYDVIICFSDNIKKIHINLKRKIGRISLKI